MTTTTVVMRMMMMMTTTLTLHVRYLHHRYGYKYSLDTFQTADVT